MPVPAAPAAAAPAAEPVAQPSAAAAPASAAPPSAVEPAPAAADSAVPAAPIVEPAEAALKPHTEEAGLLGEPAKPAEPPKPAEPAAEAKPGEEAPAVAVEPIKYEAPMLPDGISLDGERLAGFDTMLGQAGVAPELRQSLIDMHVAERKAWEDGLIQHWHDSFAETRKGWQKEARADPEIGGAGFQTSVGAANRMIALFFPDQGERDRYIASLNAMGGSDNAEVIRAWVRVARKFDEPAPAPAPQNAPPDIHRRPANGRAQASDFYDHTSSQRQRSQS